MRILLVEDNPKMQASIEKGLREVGEIATRVARLAAEAARGIGVELYDAPHSVEVGGTRILLAHDLSEVAARSIESHSIVVHGATHVQESSLQGDTLLVNPGEACGWLHGTPSAAILDITTREVEFLTLSGEQWRY